MSDDQENVDRLTESLQRSQTARELEIQLRRLRKAGVVLHGKKTVRKETGKQVPQMELKLPDIHSTQPAKQKPQRDGLNKSRSRNNSKAGSRKMKAQCVSRREHFEGQDYSSTSQKLDFSLHGNSFERVKTLAIEPSKHIVGCAGKQFDMYCFECCEKGILPVLSGPCFSPWIGVKKEKKKLAIDRGHFSWQEANVHRFYSKEQRPRSDCFNLSKILSEISEIKRASECQTKEESLCLTASYKILCPETKRSQEKRQDWPLEEPENAWTVPKKVITVKKEQRLKKLLRRKLISCYDLGPVMEPFHVIEGERLNRSNSLGEDKVNVDFLQSKQAIFPFAVPHFRSPFFPMSRSEMVKVSQVLTRCQLFPWQLKDLAEVKKQNELENAVVTSVESKLSRSALKSANDINNKTTVHINLPANVR